MKKVVVIIVIVLGVLYWFAYRSNKQNLHAVLPEKTVFFIDPELSKNLHGQMCKVIEKLYAQSKDPQQVITDSSMKFPEIESMKVQICQSDKICFYIEASKPICLLNADQVVCENGSLVDQDHFDEKIVQNLISVKTNNKQNKEFIVQFIQSLPEVFKKIFNIEFVSQNDIVLIDKQNKNFVMQAAICSVPTVKDLDLCKKIVDEVALKPRFKKKIIMCDVRFKNQIIVR